MTTEKHDLTPTHAEEPSPFDYIQHAKRRAFCEALAITGSRTAAAEAVSISRWTIYNEAWKNDPDFQRGLKLADEISADTLQYEARRRAVEGVRRYKFHSRTGEPLRHPETCECGAPWSRHVEAADGTWPCPETGCPEFRGAPYYEHEYSDKLLLTLLKAHFPDTFGDRLAISGGLRNINFTLLPAHILERLAGGKENPLAVLLSALHGDDQEGAARVRAAIGITDNEAEEPQASEFIPPPPPPPPTGLEEL